MPLSPIPPPDPFPRQARTRQAASAGKVQVLQAKKAGRQAGTGRLQGEGLQGKGHRQGTMAHTLQGRQAGNNVQGVNKCK